MIFFGYIRGTDTPPCRGGHGATHLLEVETMLDIMQFLGGTLLVYREQSQFWSEGGRGTITKVVQNGNSVDIETDATASFVTDFFNEWELREHEGVTYLKPAGGWPSSSISYAALAPEGVMIPRINERKVNPMDLFL